MICSYVCRNDNSDWLIDWLVGCFNAVSVVSQTFNGGNTFDKQQKG